ncbi:MAG: S41 family peptidase, partial [Verrucomicrobia bacterium]|nr:S41 family peptidase [Verrucomicrobiota bacterium]
LGYLGARLSAVERGLRVDEVYRTDPDYPEDFAPLSRVGVEVKEADVILSVDGVSTKGLAGIGELLADKAGRQVLLEVWQPREAAVRKVLVEPIDARGFRALKMANWEYTRRLETEERGKGSIGYFHMNAMGSGNFAEFVKGYYPVYDRAGLVIDMRQNYGGNIDSWILGRLSRKPWMYWKTRTGEPFANMQYAFDGHMVCLIDAYTISDGEAFAEGFRRLGLGPLVGTRTWGGGVWLRGNTGLVDGGMARSPETGVYDPTQAWIIEGDGVEPDILVDNLPHETFLGKDAQLEAAIAYLKEKMEKEPRKVPPAPVRPDKAFEYPKE